MDPKKTSSPSTMPLWVVLALAAGPMVSLGFARFAYALMLPAMTQSLHWSLTIAGAMNTANALGYLFGALIAPWLARRYRLEPVFVMNLVLTAIAILATGLTVQNGLLASFRFLSGVCGGVVFVVGGGIVAEASANDSHLRAGTLLGLYFGGAGLGIALSAWIVPAFLVSFSNPLGWQLAWVVLGIVSLLTLLGVIPASRNTVRITHDKPKQDVAHNSTQLKALCRISPIFMAYGLFGAGYIVYMTFIIAYLQNHGIGAGEIVWFWTVLGGFAMLAPGLGGKVLGGTPRGWGTGGAMLVVLSGVILPLLSTATGAVLASAVLFGAFLAVVTSVTTIARRNLPPKLWTKALAFLTVAFGIGQSLGPFMTGWVSQNLGGVGSGLIVSAVILGVGALMAFIQRDHPGALASQELSRRDADKEMT